MNEFSVKLKSCPNLKKLIIICFCKSWYHSWILWGFFFSGGNWFFLWLIFFFLGVCVNLGFLWFYYSAQGCPDWVGKECFISNWTLSALNGTRTCKSFKHNTNRSQAEKVLFFFVFFFIRDCGYPVRANLGTLKDNARWAKTIVQVTFVLQKWLIFVFQFLF